MIEFNRIHFWEQIMPELPVKASSFLDKVEMGLGAWSWGDRFFWQYGHGYDDNDIEAAFRTSLAAGINLIDTAEIYGSGRSERLLGKFLKTTQQPVIVATKFFPIPYRLTKKSVVRALHGSLERLGLDHVDLYQLHWPNPVISNDRYIEGLAMAVQAGLTLTVGVSNYNLNQMQQARNILSKHGIPLASNQVEFSLLDRGIERNGLLKKCEETGVRLIAYSPLAKGMLTGKYSIENPPPGPRGRKYAPILKNLPQLIALMTEIGEGHAGKTPSQVALNWVICKGALPIPGAKTAQQADQNNGAVGWHLTTEEMQALELAGDKLA
jgi:aryl-alcohol dehydrogenase-like predicted oxidoreductase